MVLFILVCSQVFSIAFRGLSGEKLIEDLFAFLPGGVNADIWFLMALIFVLGFFIEWIEISYIAVPLFLPVLLNQGVDPVWLAMLITVNLQSSFLTPPFGWALFYLKGVAPPEVWILGSSDYGAQLAAGTWTARIPVLGWPGGIDFIPLIVGGALISIFALERFIDTLIAPAAVTADNVAKAEVV